MADSVRALQSVSRLGAGEDEIEELRAEVEELQSALRSAMLVVRQHAGECPEGEHLLRRLGMRAHPSSARTHDRP